MPLTISKLSGTADEQRLWDEFLNRAKPSTFLHAWEWGEFETKLGRPALRFAAKSGEQIVAVALATVIKARRGTFLLCHHGPILDPIRSADERANILATLLAELEKEARSQNCVFMRVSTSLPNQEDGLKKAFADAGFRNAPIHVHSELSWIVDISGNDDQLFAEMKKNTRYGIRKAERDGITVSSSENPADIEKFWELYSRTAERQTFTPYSKDYIKKEFEIFAAQGMAKWYFAEYQGRTVSGALIVFTPWSSFYHHGASAHDLPSITPSELLQWRIMQDARNRGCTKHNFWGIAPENRPQHPWAGLSKFKKGFGGYAEPYIHAQDKALSWRYWPNFLLETYRRIKRKV